MRMRIRRFDLPLRHVFTIARGSTHSSRTLIVELSEGDVCGWGEAGESSYYGATVENMSAALEQARQQIESSRVDDPTEFWEALRPALADHPFAQCALDLAANDLWGKLQGKPLWQLWGLSLDRCPVTDYTIGIDTPQRMLAKLQEFPGWPIYKIKLDARGDLEPVRLLRRHTDAPLRVDANASWTVQQTLRNAEALRGLGVEFIEQPLSPDDWPGMRQLAGCCALPLVADESCAALSDVDRCARLFHGVNVKLVKCGGLSPARRIIDRAKQRGLKVMLGCMTESTVGISAAAQLLPLADYADLDGALLLAADVATGVTIDAGRFCFPQESDCQCRLQVTANGG